MTDPTSELRKPSVLLGSQQLPGEHIPPYGNIWVQLGGEDIPANRPQAPLKRAEFFYQRRRHGNGIL